MLLTRHLCFILLVTVIISCDLKNGDKGTINPGDSDPVPYRNVSSTNLPLNSLAGNSMDAQSVDIDSDGDVDLIIAIEFGPNKLLLNDGSGVFSDQSSGRLPARNYDSEDVAVADYNRDGLFDVFFASEDNQTNEFYLNQGGTFADAIGRIPVTGTSNAVEANDVDNDGDIDLLIGNNGQNVLLINNGNAFFSDQTGQRLPGVLDITQDVEFGDIDGDGDLDIAVANEDGNRILVNTGSGFYSDQTSNRLPLTGGVEETREADFGDVDADGDLDLYFSNVVIFQSGSNPQDRLLINNGQGVFIDRTTDQLPADNSDTVDADFFDIDGDGDLDILAGDFRGGARVLINDGTGSFNDETDDWLPENFSPRVVDFDVSDYNGDGLPDIYIANFQSEDALLIRRSE